MIILNSVDFSTHSTDNADNRSSWDVVDKLSIRRRSSKPLDNVYFDDFSPNLWPVEMNSSRSLSTPPVLAPLNHRIFEVVICF